MTHPQRMAELIAKHGQPIISECSLIEQVMPNKPKWWKAQSIASNPSLNVTEEKAMEALTDYQKAMEL